MYDVELACIARPDVVVGNAIVMLYPVALFVFTTVRFVPVAYPPVRPAIEPTIAVADVVAMNEISFVICCVTVKLLVIARLTDGSNERKENASKDTARMPATKALFAEYNKCVCFMLNE